MLAYIDHVTIAVREAGEAGDQLRRNLSLIVTKPRHDDESDLTNAMAPLTRGYVELVSPGAMSVKSKPVNRRLHTFLDSGEGLFSFALNSGDIRKDVAVLRERGAALSEPENENAGSASDAGWWTSFPSEQELEPYLIQHDQKAAVAMSMAGGRQPLGIRTVEEVVLVVPTVDELVSGYERDFGITVHRRIGRQVQLAAGTSRIMLVPAATAPLGTPIGIYSVSLGTTDIKGAQATLRQRGVDFGPALFSWGVAVEIDPAQTFGARVNLVQV